MAVIDLVDQFRATLLSLRIGNEYVYHRGHLALDRVGRPALNTIGKITGGLQIAGHVELVQKRLGEGLTEYRLRVLRTIHQVDLDRALKLWEQSLERE